MRRKSSTSKSGRKTASAGGRRVPWFVLFRFFVIFSCLFIICLLWLDHRIQSEFEGKRWALPARVYARPTEIFVGQNLSMQELIAELEATGYQSGAQLTVGAYRYEGNELQFVKRPFSFWDADESAQQFNISIKNNRVSELREQISGEQAGLIRLEPQLIGKIYPQHNEDRVLVPYREVPPFLIAALVAVEDRHFFSHSGVDLRGILRALLTNLAEGRISQGGSTLTQQLVKNFFLTHERTFSRKFTEMLMSLLLERRYNKADILSAYINEVYLGQNGARGIHGFGTAAEYYFAKPLQELRNDQLALLVGLVKGASYYNPYRHPQRALKRRNLVLELMQEHKYDSPARLQAAMSRALDIAKKPSWSQAKYPAFLDMVRRQLLRDYRLQDLRTEGLRIFTTLNPRLQDKIESAVARQLPLLEKNKNHAAGSLQVAAVVLHVGSGEVLGLIGGRERENISFNRALDARRAIGSLVKPVVYYTALKDPARFNLLSQVDDTPVSLKLGDGSLWKPQNYDRKTHPNITLLEALAHSYNLATVNLGLQIGLQHVIEVLADLGVSRSVKKYPSLLLGAIELSPLQVAQVYQSFANGGFRIRNNVIREVMTSNSKALHRYPLHMEQVLDPAAVFLSNFMMMEAVRSGTARGLSQVLAANMPLAGKTGTTNDLRDSWFAGFGDEMLGVVWLGLDDNKPSGLTGAAGAMRVWAEMMKKLDIKPLKLLAPEEIDWLSSRGRQCHPPQQVPYIKGYKPADITCK